MHAIYHTVYHAAYFARAFDNAAGLILDCAYKSSTVLVKDDIQYVDVCNLYTNLNYPEDPPALCVPSVKAFSTFTRVETGRISTEL